MDLIMDMERRMNMMKVADVLLYGDALVYRHALDAIYLRTLTIHTGSAYKRRLLLQIDLRRPQFESKQLPWSSYIFLRSSDLGLLTPMH